MCNCVEGVKEASPWYLSVPVKWVWSLRLPVASKEACLLYLLVTLKGAVSSVPVSPSEGGVSTVSVSPSEGGVSAVPVSSSEGGVSPVPVGSSEVGVTFVAFHPSEGRELTLLAD